MQTLEDLNEAVIGGKTYYDSGIEKECDTCDCRECERQNICNPCYNCKQSWHMCQWRLPLRK